jgi:protein required for attachment to host cells
MKKWILVANSSYAQFYSWEGEKIEPLEKIDYPRGRQKVHDLLTDKPGRSFAIASTERHALSEGSDVKAHEQELFANQLASKCDQAKKQGLCDHLVIVAPSHFLGMLRLQMKKHHPEMVVQEIHKDLPEGLSATDKLRHLYNFLSK